MALRSEFRAQIGHLGDGPMWVNGKMADLAKKISPLFGAPGRAQVAYQVAGANSKRQNRKVKTVVILSHGWAEVPS